MPELLKSLLVISLFSLIPGQLIRLPFFGPSGALTVSDISVIALDIYFIAYSILYKKTLVFSKRIFFPALIFSLWATATTIMAANVFASNQIAVAFLFLARFIGYFFVSQIVINVIPKNKVGNWINLVLLTIVIYAVLGFLQLLFFPNLTFLTIYGWDPHIMRIASTLLDPNFSGLLFVFAFVISAAKFLEIENNKKYLFLTSGIVSIFALIFTFSRSSYLAFITAVLVLGLTKSKKLLVALVAFSFGAYLIFPQVQSRVIGALTVDDTSQARIESWRNAIEIYAKNPVIGVGFNTYRFAQNKYELFENDAPLGGHSGAGSDSSLLLVAATTGTIGLIIFLFFQMAVFKSYLKKANKNATRVIGLATFAALIVHSQFVNSFFFPQIMLYFWFIHGLVEADDS